MGERFWTNPERDMVVVVVVEIVEKLGASSQFESWLKEREILTVRFLLGKCVTIRERSEYLLFLLLGLYEAIFTIHLSSPHNADNSN